MCALPRPFILSWCPFVDIYLVARSLPLNDILSTKSLCILLAGINGHSTRIFVHAGIEGRMLRCAVQVVVTYATLRFCIYSITLPHPYIPLHCPVELVAFLARFASLLLLFFSHNIASPLSLTMSQYSSLLCRYSRYADDTAFMAAKKDCHDHKQGVW
jgi:hypothetical protein